VAAFKKMGRSIAMSLRKTYALQKISLISYPEECKQH